jgi:hypothetical protein
MREVKRYIKYIKKDFPNIWLANRWGVFVKVVGENGKFLYSFKTFKTYSYVKLYYNDKTFGTDMSFQSLNENWKKNSKIKKDLIEHKLVEPF